MKKFRVLAITAVLLLSAITANAAEIPIESAPGGATKAEIVVVENLIGDVLDEVQNGLGYQPAWAKANKIVYDAVLAHQTDGYGYGMLAGITRNAIFQYRDMYLRPEYYMRLNEKLKVLLADLIVDVKNGKDYYIAYEEAQTLIYKSANPSYDPDVDRVGDFCYWNVPAVDGAEFAVARRLLLEAKNGN